MFATFNVNNMTSHQFALFIAGCLLVLAGVVATLGACGPWLSRQVTFIGMYLGHLAIVCSDWVYSTQATRTHVRRYRAQGAHRPSVVAARRVALGST